MSNRKNRVLKGVINNPKHLKGFDSPKKTRLRINKSVNTCEYCGAVVPDGEGTFTKKKLLICKDCKPVFFTPLERVTETIHSRKTLNRG